MAEDGGRVLGDQVSDLLVLRFSRINDDVAVEDHSRAWPSRPGSGRSLRISRCHATGSGMAVMPPASASFCVAAAIAAPRAAAAAIWGFSTTVSGPGNP